MRINYFHLALIIVLSLLCKSVYSQNIIIEPYLQNLCQTEVTVMWELDVPGTSSVMWGDSPFTMTNNTASTSVNVSGTSEIHTAFITGLAAKSKYYYRVTTSTGTMSPMRTFVTISDPADNESVQFMALSDMQRDGSHPDKFREIVEDGIIAIMEVQVGPSLNDLEGLIIPGDLVATGGSYNQWKNNFFNPSDSLTGYVPLYPVPGNHEYFSGGLPNFKHYFTMPANSPVGLEDQCWYKDISNVRIIGLNSNSGGADQDTQLDWLNQVLATACSDEHIDFVFAQLHHPYKSELWTPGENDFTGMVIDSLENFTTNCSKASLHFFGHTHGYSRGQSRDHKHLWVNVATAGGAIDNWGEFPNADYKEFVKSQDEYGFVYIDVEAGDDPLFTMKRYGRGDQDAIVDNELRDQITLINNDIAPEKPSNIYPVLDSVNVGCLYFKASDFVGLDDTLQASQWQIATDPTIDGFVVAEDWWQSENYYNEINMQANDDLTDAEFSGISTESDYYWRVRYRNQNLEWSPWSDPTMFYLKGAVDTLSVNLLLNPDAENGIANWTGDIESLNDSECGSVPPYEGTHNFGVGGICANESSIGIASQNIDLSAFSSQIDADTVSIAFGGFLRNYSGSDVPEMYVEIYDGSTLVNTSNTVSNVTTTWTYVSDEIKLPIGVDNCTVYLKGTRNAGQDNDSYFDLLNIHLVALKNCPTCVGDTQTDDDLDGFCDDIDCEDKNSQVYPGAIELCDGIDNNCDGVADNGDTVTWTGLANTTLWSDAANWDQNLVPLPCQHVIIDNASDVFVDGDFQCRSIEVGLASSLSINTNQNLVIHSVATNNYPSALIKGTMIINGSCIVKESNNAAFDVYGTLVNNNKLKTESILLDAVLLRTGGQFNSNGLTRLR